MTPPSRTQVIGRRIKRIGHSSYSAPCFIMEGVGPASFRHHFLELENGIVLRLMTAHLSVAQASDLIYPGDTEGMQASTLIGLVITNVWRDDVDTTILILERKFYLKDANDGVYGNPLRAGIVSEDYTDREMKSFVDYWTEQIVEKTDLKY